jgi:Novel STAND NTPase 3/Restriction endonuclease
LSRFDVLDDLEFEDLCAELLRAETGLAYRAGPRGRDEGVDLLATEDGQRHEAQCKHYRRGGSSALKRAARREAQKLSRRAPKLGSYRFLCSARLSHKAREELGQILSGWLAGGEHLLDESDMERLLELHPEIERRFVKLWFQGVGQLRNVLSAASHARSRALLADIRSSMSRYVETAAFREAKARLDAEAILIVAGAPGVGKTTLAALLVMDSLAAGYSPYEIVPGELSAAWELLQDGQERQLFVFDDFLGRATLEALRSADRDLVRFMREVRRSGTARLVITSREYILQEARKLSELLDTEIQGEGRFLLQMEDYTRLEKARIFYHHLWLSPELDGRARRALLRRRAYERIIDHPNYNPRLIEWVTGFSAHTLSPDDHRSYVDFCLSVLDSPKQLWSIAFESGIGDAGRALLFALVLLPPRTPVARLETAFASAAEAATIDQRRRLFKRTLSVPRGLLPDDSPGAGAQAGRLDPESLTRGLR